MRLQMELRGKAIVHPRSALRCGPLWMLEASTTTLMPPNKRVSQSLIAISSWRRVIVPGTPTGGKRAKRTQQPMWTRRQAAPTAPSSPHASSPLQFCCQKGPYYSCSGTLARGIVREAPNLLAEHRLPVMSDLLTSCEDGWRSRGSANAHGCCADDTRGEHVRSRERAFKVMKNTKRVGINAQNPNLSLRQAGHWQAGEQIYRIQTHPLLLARAEPRHLWREFAAIAAGWRLHLSLALCECWQCGAQLDRRAGRYRRHRSCSLCCNVMSQRDL